MSESTREQIIEGRRRLRAEYGELFDGVAKILYLNDPVGLNFAGCPPDEYEPEAGTILPKLRNCHSADDVLELVHSEVVRWFDAEIAGPREHYRQLASEIWTLWSRSDIAHKLR